MPCLWVCWAKFHLQKEKVTSTWEKGWHCGHPLKLIPNTQINPCFLCNSFSSFVRRGPSRFRRWSFGSGLCSLRMGPWAFNGHQLWPRTLVSTVGVNIGQEKRSFLWNTEKAVFENFCTSWEELTLIGAESGNTVLWWFLSQHLFFWLQWPRKHGFSSHLDFVQE